MVDDKHKLDELRQSLYRRGEEDEKPRGWSRFTSKKQDVPDDWKHEHTLPSVGDEAPAKRRFMQNLPIRFFVFSVIFFIVAIGVAAFIINRGSNIVSADKIELAVSGPVTVAGGDPLELQIDVVNLNNTTLELVDLIIEFPEGTKDPEGGGTELARLRESLENLSPGEGASRTISALLFGEEGDQKDIQVGIEYRVADSNAIFFKESIFSVQIGTAPISVLVDMPTEIHSGQEIEIVAEVISNASETLDNVALTIEYPFGFLLSDTQPSADVGDNTWFFGGLAPQDRRTVNVVGTLEAQDAEERTFRFTGGLADSGSAQAIETVLLETKRSIAISRPLLQAELVLGNSSGDVHVAEPAQTVSGTIFWQNNLPVSVEDAQIEVVLTGDVLDETSVTALNGFYRSIDNTIIWDKSRYAAFEMLEPGARGQVSFEFRSIDPTIVLFEQGSVDVSLEISGNRIGDTPETTGEVSSTLQKIVQFASYIGLDTWAAYWAGPFTNSGPIPPQAEQHTTYTVTWNLSNASNNILDAYMSAALPDYVEWVGSVSPSSESVTFNSASSEVQWDIGLLSSGTGYTSPPEEVSFQVRILPSISQVGTAPVLVGAATFTGQDSFTGATRQAIGWDLTTAITRDPTYTSGDDKVGGG